MQCLFCDKNLHKDVEENFVCICNKCLDVAEKSEARMVKMICEIRDMLKQEQNDRKSVEVYEDRAFLDYQEKYPNLFPKRR